MRRVTLARRIAVVSAMLVCVLLTVASASAQVQAGAKPPVTAIDAHSHKRLPVNPLLHPGSEVILTVPGFAIRANVLVAILHVGIIDTVHANAEGVVSYRFIVPTWMRRGQHTLIFSGPAPQTKHKPLPKHRQHLRRDIQTVVVTVPYDPPWRFRTGPSKPPVHHHRGHGTGGEHGHHGTQGGSYGSPAETGIDLVPLLVIGPVAVLLGALALLIGRRRLREHS